jgi:hypothetical protein
VNDRLKQTSETAMHASNNPAVIACRSAAATLPARAVLFYQANLTAITMAGVVAAALLQMPAADALFR